MNELTIIAYLSILVSSTWYSTKRQLQEMAHDYTENLSEAARNLTEEWRAQAQEKGAASEEKTQR